MSQERENETQRERERRREELISGSESYHIKLLPLLFPFH